MASQTRQHLVWLITGTSSGFGTQFVHSILARGDKVIATARGDKVIATARTLDKIKHLDAAGAKVMRLDLTDSQESIGDTVTKAIAVHGHIDVLVNNAAFISTGMIDDLTSEDFLAQFDTNVFGTIKVTRALLPHFRSRRSGTCVFISSLSGWIGHPGCAPYASSKFAIEAFAESLEAETKHLGIRTFVIEPGRFRTKFLSTGNLQTKRSGIEDYAEFSRAQIEYLASEDQKQPGDPVKLVQVVLDLVRQEGVAEGREVPFRLQLGGDCVDEIRRKCEETLRVMEEWGEVCKGTDVVE